MKDLKTLRNEIDQIDDQLMKLLDERMQLSKQIGRNKIEAKMEIENIEREKEVLVKAKNFTFANQINDIYKEIIQTSKNIQKYDYFLVGKTLNYSFSGQIYSLFGLRNYNLLETDDFEVLKKVDFKGINVTIPYKESAFKMCDFLSDEAKLTKSVNTIINTNNRYYGYNTDYFGMTYLLDYNQINVKGKKIIIIGNGATSRTISAVVKEKGASSVKYLVRTVRNEDEERLENYHKFLDYEIIFNATPYGTFPNAENDPLFSLEGFNNLETVIDVVYNPINTPLINAAKNFKIKAVSGLMMLVAQAAKSLSLYLNQDYTNKIVPVYKNMLIWQQNIVLIGMPYSGKSTLGKKLAVLLNKKLVDVDNELKKLNLDLKTVLENQNLAFYRENEAMHTIQFGKKWDQVISTGGGIVLNPKAMHYLKNNGIVIFINPPIEKLLTRLDDNRPLIKGPADLVRLYHERINLYHQYADITINDDIEINALLEKIYEYQKEKYFDN